MTEPKTITLSAGKTVLVDAADFEWLSQWKWCFHQNGYAFRTERRGQGKVQIFMHRLIKGNPISRVGFKNRNRLDCQRENLVLVTNGQNTAKAVRRKDSGFPRGVQPRRGRGSFEARIMVEGRSKYLGSFPTIEAAAAAYDAAAQSLYGELAVTNH